MDFYEAFSEILRSEKHSLNFMRCALRLHSCRYSGCIIHRLSVSVNIKKMNCICNNSLTPSSAMMTSGGELIASSQKICLE